MGVDPEASWRSLLEDVASSAPTPGGGSVAALAGALGAALAAMVCRLTLGKKGYEDVQEAAELHLARAESLRSRFQDLAGEDAAAYDAVSQAFRRDRSTDEAKRARSEAIQAALKGAAEVPLETATRSVDLLRVVADVARVGNTNALSDAGAASHLALAAFYGARLNVEVNLASLRDGEYAEKARAQLERLRDGGAELHAATLAALKDRADLG